MAIYSEAEQSMGSLIIGHVQISNENFYGEEIGVGPVAPITWPKGLLLAREEGGSNLVPYQPGLTGDPIMLLSGDIAVGNPSDYPIACSTIIGGSVRRDKLFKYLGGGTFTSSVTPTETDLMRKFRCIGTSVIDLTVRSADDTSTPYNPSEFGAGLLHALYGNVGVTLAGGKATSWAPAYGTGCAVSQATETKQPVPYTDADGKIGLNFAGNKRMLCQLFPTNENAGALTIISAFSLAGVDADGAWLMGITNSAGAGSGLHQVYSSTSQAFVEGRSGSSLTARPLKAAKTRVVMGWSQDTSEAIGWSSVGAVGSAGSYVPVQIRDLCIGNRDDAIDVYSFNAPIYSIWIFRSKMNAATLAAACAKMTELYPEVT